MKIASVTLHLVKMRLVTPFKASYGEVTDREVIIIEVKDYDGVTGWGECVAFSVPWYTEETIQTCYHMLEDFLIPSLLEHENVIMSEYVTHISKFKRNHMAKSALEAALWDLYARIQGQSLSMLWGGTRTEIEAGVVIGLAPIAEMTKQIETHLADGYKRFKIKIKPGHDENLLRSIRAKFPTLPLMADANSAYTLHDIDHLRALDEFNLMMIEQPLGSDDIVDHAKLQKSIATPICLDESILSSEDARKAIELGSCKIMNIKMGRVGGFTEAKKIHDLCMKHDLPVWCGGMLETGISRAHNIALASLPQFSIPGDISASSRYWEKDIILPEVKVVNGKIHVPTSSGMGVTVDTNQLNKKTYFKKRITKVE